MDITEFEELVAADIRYQEPTDDNPSPDNKISEEDRVYLRDPDNLGRWMFVLKGMMRKTDSQLASHKAEACKKRLEYFRSGPKGKSAWLTFQASEATWRGNAIRFKRSVEDRLAEAKELKRTITPNLPAREETHEIVRLRTAIARHRDGFEDDPSSDDENLWNTLNITA